MAPASASFHSATKGLERMKDESPLNTTHGNGGGLRRAKGMNLFHAADQRSVEVLERAKREGWNQKKKECVSYNEECGKK